MNNKKNKTKPFICKFCHAGFMKERTLINHLCESKRRYMNKDHINVRIAFRCWLLWYELTNTKIKKGKIQYDIFSNSKLYIDFVKFGSHIVDLKISNSDNFIKFIVKNHIRLQDWCNEGIYNAYIKNMLRKEDISTALDRYIKITEQWELNNNEQCKSFLYKININIALNMIRAGKISPWILLNAVHKNELFNRMSDEQIMLVDTYIDLTWWRQYMIRNKIDAHQITKLLEASNI